MAEERAGIMQLAISKVLSGVACVLMLCASAPTPAVAEQAQYIYDDLGRLSQVIDGQGNVATYAYDAVGKLLSITRITSWGFRNRNVGGGLVLE